MLSCWPNVDVSATADMLSRLSMKLEKLVFSPPSSPDEPRTWGGLSSPLMFYPGRSGGRSSEVPRRSWSPPRATSFSTPAAREETTTDQVSDEEKTADHRDGEAAAVPCVAVAFGSMDGYKVFDFGENRMCGDGDVRLRLVHGRRHVPSPSGGKVFATDMCGRRQAHLIDPFTGERTPLPDLPVPLSEEEPMPFEPDEPRWRLSTDDEFAWDWSPRGVMVARGDTVFFCEAGGSEGGKWTPVHRSRRSNSLMTVNYRDGFFFVLEQRSLLTTVIDAGTLDRRAEIEPPPRVDDIDRAFLVASTHDVLMLVHRKGDGGELLSQAYRARHRQQRRPPRWQPVTDIGDRAAFVDSAHGFTVRAGERAQRNRVHMLHVKLEGAPSQRGGAMVHVVGVAPLNNLKKMVYEEESKLTDCKVQPIWGAAHWIVRDHGSSSPTTTSNIALDDTLVGLPSTNEDLNPV